MTKTKVAVVQAAPMAFNLAETLQRVGSWTAQAAKTGARLVLFPEAFVGGYPRGLTFETSIGHRGDTGRDWFARYWAGAIDVPGPAVDALAACAQAGGVWLVIGVIERAGGTLHCSVLFFAPDGTLQARHRKLMPTGAERLIWGQGDGSTMPVLDTPIGRLGAAICWENYMPFYRMYLYSKNLQI